MAKIKFPPVVRSAMAQVIVDKADLGSGASKLKFFTRSIGVWSATTAYPVGATVYMNGKNYDCTTAGTSGGSAPTWPASGTVTDGTVVWTEGGDAGADTLLGTLTCSDPSATVTAGVITFASVTQDSFADATGKARRVALTDSDDNTVSEFDVTPSGGGGAITMNTVNIVIGGPILMNSLVITMGGA